ncbi:hypothetical protein TL16_g07464 [Triparma laevis f. inornata]|uniref:Uncharacterized protein n=1 Tax=Triparma laevis f. inornata TaxID=1714386 RepID=A0A9W7B117_9STRA|nr:hypothetical protein TL16_g07464 [Triparma laevis f. inornata]
MNLNASIVNALLTEFNINKLIKCYEGSDDLMKEVENIEDYWWDWSRRPRIRSDWIPELIQKCTNRWSERQKNFKRMGKEQ